MSLPTTYTQESKKLKDFFNKIRDAQAPQKFTQQLLKDWGYKSNNHRAFIPLLKALGFLTADGSPTQRYHEYRNHSVSSNIMANALRDAYSDIFLIKEKPTQSDKLLIAGKFKSFHNASPTVANLMTKTFYSLLELADLNNNFNTSEKIEKYEMPMDSKNESLNTKDLKIKDNENLGLHYNIQIHLPATKDLEVYNAIFKSLKDHLIE
jgi:hypothetical protein